MDYERLARYFAGECTTAERAAIDAWLAADDTRRRHVELLRQGWELATPIVARGDVERSFAAISSRLDAEPEAREPRVLHLRRPLRRRAVWVVGTRAAAILLAVALGAIVARRGDWRAPAASPVRAPISEERTVSTKAGQRASIYLSDGSHVMLGVGSTLKFPTAFDSSRDVELDGEAYFEVAHDTSRSFAVHMPYGTARDLGTKFAVRAYRDIAAATVTVTEGSVLLTPTARTSAGSRALSGRRSRATDSLILSAMDVARVTADGRLSVTRAVRSDETLAWMAGRLVFRQMPVREAVAQINRWYGVDVRLGDSTLATYTLTASLTTEPFPQAIRIIAEALDARAVRHNASFTLYSNRESR